MPILRKHPCVPIIPLLPDATIITRPVSACRKFGGCVSLFSIKMNRPKRFSRILTVAMACLVACRFGAELARAQVLERLPPIVSPSGESAPTSLPLGDLVPPPILAPSSRTSALANEPLVAPHAAMLEGAAPLSELEAAPWSLGGEPPVYSSLDQQGEPVPEEPRDTTLATSEPWTWQLMPEGLIYRSYLAGVKEPRIASVFNYDKGEGWKWDSTLGGRVSVLRYGTTDGYRPQGWEIDLEGASMQRLDMEEYRDLDAVDFRFGFPITYGIGNYQTKLSYYHLCSHVGDEYLLKHPTFNRLNYVRDVIVWGHSYYVTDDLRVYGEVGWGMSTDISKPWELQCGADYSPAGPTTFRGAPFAAVNGHLRQDFNFGGNFTAQAGWQWRGGAGGHLFRAGLQYYNGQSDQYEFFQTSEQKIGLGLWYDY